MVAEVIKMMDIKPGGIYLDATYGRGGHSRMILNSLNSNGRLICSDTDPIAIAHAKQNFNSDKRVEVIHSSFDQIANKILKKLKKIDGALIDCGMCTDQLNNSDRGFSFSSDSFLDMRMNNQKGFTAATYLNNVSGSELSRVLREYGEEKNAGALSRAIIKVRKNKPITTTQQLVNVIKKNNSHRDGKNSATRTFQALRIVVNNELEQISEFVKSIIDILNDKGKLAVITFHSLEVRALRAGFRMIKSRDKFKQCGELTVPHKSEIANNPSARSAQLRVFEKCIK